MKQSQAQKLLNQLKLSLIKLLRARFSSSNSSQRLLKLVLCATLSAIAVVYLPLPSQSKTTAEPVELVQQGQEFYEAGQLDRAIDTWQQAAVAYEAQGDRLGSRESQINTATAQQALGLYPQSCQSLIQAFELSGQTNCTAILEQAQIVEPQLEGTVPETKTSKDKFIPAIAGIREQQNTVNKATGLLRFGDYLRESGYPQVAAQTIKYSLETAQQLENPNQETAALLSLGNTERAIAFRKQSQFPPQTVALDVISNAGGSSDVALAPYQPTLKYYQQAAQVASSPADSLKAELNQLSLWLDIEDFWQQATTELKNNAAELGITDSSFLEQITTGAATLEAELANNLKPQIIEMSAKLQPQIASLPGTRSGIYSRINFAQSLIRQERNDENTVQILATAIKQARQINNVTAQAEAMGYLGYVYEQQQQYPEARQLTEAALQLAPTAEYPELAYRWNAQLGRILALEGNRDNALIAYESSFNTIRALRSDLATTPVEPIFREYISLLLQTEPTPNQLNQARDVLESLQIVKLDNFFRDPCSEVAEEPVIIDEVDAQAAVIYPIVLPDRLEVILTLPGQPLRHYSSAVSNTEVENKIKQLRRQSLSNPGYAEEIRGFRGNPAQQQQIQQLQTSLEESLNQNILPLASEIYNWLIEPAAADLQANKVKTLVFVLDGSLRNIPMSLLYDQKNQQYLIEKDYNIALSSGLQLTAPKPLPRQPIKVLAAGVTKDYPQYRFPPIPKVEDELNQIKSIFGKSEILLNQEFTEKSLQEKLQQSDFPVVHLATHGQFGSTSDQTFILSGSESGSPLINVNRFDNLLRTGNLRRSQPIELLVLSACNTAEGDNQAILGLAGVAVRAGARSTIATLWGANDEATAELMSKFYENLAADAQISKAKALRDAQLSLLATQDSQYRHPYYWAPFVLIGNWL